VLAELDARGLSENTVVIFTADQANLYGQHGLWGHTTNTYPSHLYDAGLRIPLIIRRPGHIPAAVIGDQFVSQYDLPASLMDYLGYSDVEFAHSPGRSYAPLLNGHSVDDWTDAVYFEQEETRGVRTERYSYWTRLADVGRPVLFDLDNDPDQRHDVADDPAYANIVADLDRRLTSFYDRYADPRYDLWRGGRAKGSVMRVNQYQALYGPDWSPIADTQPTFAE
jgi:arylsulfatase A-like enzyme